jgi:PAS domain S-box-containing protein
MPGNKNRRSILKSLAVALVLVAVAVGVRIWPLHELGLRLTFVTFYPAVVIAALYGGLSTGLLATFFSCLTLVFWWPVFFGQPIIEDYADWQGVAVFVLTCTMISGITEAMRRSRALAKQVQADLQRTNAELQQSRDTLENQVSKRTAELEQAKAGLEKELADRKQIEADLKESEARLKRSQDIARLGSWELDVVNNALTWSDEVYRIFGLRPQEFKATFEAFLEAVHPDDLQAVDERYSKSLREGKDTYEIEHRVIRKSTGEIRHVHERCNHVRDETGAVIRSIGMVHDITERKQASERIAKQNSILESVNRILEAGLTSTTEEELGKTCLKVVEEITGSAFAFIGEIGADGNMHDLAISDPGWEACAMEDKAGHGRLKADFRLHGIYGRVLIDGKSLIANDPASHPDRIGLPKGHPELKSFLGVPLIRDGKTIGMIAVANRDAGYGAAEQEALEALAPAVMEALGRKRAEDALHKAHEELEARVQERTAELEKAKDAVTSERQRLYDVLETLPVYVCLLDSDYCMPFANRYFRETFGEPLGRRCHDFLFSLEKPCETCESYTVMKTRAPHHWNWTGPNNRDYDIYDFPFFDADGYLLILEMGIDVTERNKAEAALKTASAYNRSLIEASLDPLVTISTEGKITDVNNATESVTGHSRHELIGSDFADYFSDPEKARNGYQKVFGNGSMTDYELEIRHRDGRLTPVMYNASVYCDESDKILGLVAAARDITEAKRLQNEREKLITELEAKNAELERFTYSVSHDLRSPLITIKTFLGFVAEDVAGKNSENLKSDLERIDKAAEKMGNLLEEILELSRVGRMFNPPSEVPGVELAKEALELLSGSIAQSGAEVYLAPDLPVLYGDRPRLLEVFQNLLENAIKFVGDQPYPKIEIGTRNGGGDTIICVRDNGIGINPQYRDKVFGLFEKLDQKSEGTGIGLALVKRIVEVHGGRIWVESEGIGHGSTFCFTIPHRIPADETGGA